jgi:hypothetical protein
MGDGEPADRDLIEHHVARVIVKPQALEVCLFPIARHRLKPKTTASKTRLPTAP